MRRSNMLRRSAFIVLAAAVLLVGVLPSVSAQRTVMAEIFGASW
jgi:hypothetical protein